MAVIIPNNANPPMAIARGSLCNLSRPNFAPRDIPTIIWATAIKASGI